VTSPQDLVEVLGDRGCRELLALLMRPTDDRVALIGKLYAEGGNRRELAETLIDQEADEVGRWEVIDALRAIVPPEERGKRW
jgi:hypothetical protein